MLLPRLTNCPECASIPSLLANIDCKLNQLASALYNNTIFALNQPISAVTMLDLLNYKRILAYRICNPNYAGLYTLNMIASRVIILTGNCKTNCGGASQQNVPVHTTTTSTSCIPRTTTTTSSSTTSTSSTTTTTTASPTTTTTTTSSEPTTTTTTTEPLPDCITFDGFLSTYKNLYNVGDYKGFVNYIVTNDTITQPSLSIEYGASYAEGYGVNFISSFTIGHSMWNSYIYNVWLSIGGISYGPYVYHWNFAGTGGFDLPLGTFNTNANDADVTYAIQISYTDYNGNDLQALLESFTVGDGIYITSCGTVPTTTTTTTIII
jgi:hypothetical protein